MEEYDNIDYGTTEINDAEFDHTKASDDENENENEELSSQERRPPGTPRDTFWIYDAVIEEITQQQNVFYVTVVYRDRPGRGRGRAQTVRLVVSRQTMVFDETRREIPARRLEEGMVIDALISSAMTRSIPPQATAFQIFIINRPARRQVTTGRILQVNVREQFIVTIQGRDFSSVIRFNVTPNTVILDPFGRRIGLQNLFPGLQVRVEHSGIQTTSIPPQTTAFEIRIVR